MNLTRSTNNTVISALASCDVRSLPASGDSECVIVGQRMWLRQVSAIAAIEHASEGSPTYCDVMVAPSWVAIT